MHKHRSSVFTNITKQLSRSNDSAREFYHSLGYRERPGYELLDKRLENG